MSYKKSYKKLRKYQYNWFALSCTLIFFPIVIIFVTIFSVAFVPYLFKYKRSGIGKGGQELNTLSDLEYDGQVKKMPKYNIKENSYKEFFIGNEEEKISVLTMEHENSDKWVIGVHGFKRNKYIGVRNVFHFYKEGYNILTFDAYAHGKTYGKKSDFGLTNSKILDVLVEWIKKTKKTSKIGILGVSMGATTSLMFAKNYYLKNKVDWIIADCPFMQAIPQIRFFLQKYTKLPWWLGTLWINFLFRLHSKTNIKEVNLFWGYEKIKDLPILYIHGKIDDFIMYDNSVVMHYKKSLFDNNKENLIIYDNAKHSQSIVNNYKDYTTRTLNFASKYNNTKTK